MTLQEAPAQRTVESTADDLFDLSHRELDALFLASPAGMIPDGTWRGSVLLFPGTSSSHVLAAIARGVFWQGKVFDRTQGSLKNLITPLRIRAIRALVSDGQSWVDERPCVVLDYSTTSLAARMVRDEIRLVGDGVYLGVVWLWSRRVAWFVLRKPAG